MSPGPRERPTAPYRRLWAIPGAPLLLLVGFTARIGLGITVLSWLLLLHATTGSYAVASLVSALFAMGTAVVTPLSGRLMDRLGPRHVLPWFGVAAGLLQLGMLAAVLAGVPLGGLLALAAAAGAALPPMNSAVRAAWTVLTAEEPPERGVRRAAMAAESSLVELIYILGPLLLSAAVLVATQLAGPLGVGPRQLGPAIAIVLAALSTGVGTLVVARGRALRELPITGPTAGGSLAGPLHVRGFPTLLGCAALLCFSFGTGAVGIAAFATAHDGASASAQVTAAWLYAVWGIGSVAAGIAYGVVRVPGSLRRQFSALLLMLAAGDAVLAVVDRPIWLGLALLLAGAAVAPSLAVESTIAGEIAPSHMVNAAFQWVTSTNQSAEALGFIVAGALVGLGGAPLCFGAGLAATALAGGLALRLELRGSAAGARSRPRAADSATSPSRWRRRAAVGRSPSSTRRRGIAP